MCAYPQNTCLGVVAKRAVILPIVFRIKHAVTEPGEGTSNWGMPQRILLMYADFKFMALPHLISLLKRQYVKPLYELEQNGKYLK